MTSEQISKYRDDTTGCTDRIHLNNAGASFVPAPVEKAIFDYLRLESSMGGYEAMQYIATQVEDFYKVGARVLNAQSHQIAYTTNATDAYNRALTSIPFQEGDIILTTNNDYVSNQIAFLQLKKRFGIEVIRAADHPEDGVDVEDMHQLIKKHQPKLVAVTHIPTSSGLIQPIEEIGVICQNHTCLYLVDACQSFGQLPIDVQAIKCDFLTATYRKFMRGPRGAGILYVSEKALMQGYEPLFSDLRGTYWVEADRYEPMHSAKRFEIWERSYALMLGAKAAMEYGLEVGFAEAASRIQKISNQLRSELATIPGAQVLDYGKKLGGIVTVHFKDQNPQEILKTLASHRINAALTTIHQARIDFEQKKVNWAIRLSPHYYNTESEIAQVIEVLNDLS